MSDNTTNTNHKKNCLAVIAQRQDPPSTTSIYQRPLTHPSDYLWYPGPEPLTKEMGAAISKLIKKNVELEIALPHDVVQAMATFRWTFSKEFTPYMAPAWWEWLEETKQMRPHVPAKLTLEELFPDQDLGTEEEQEEAQKRILGEKLYIDLQADKAYEDEWLALLK